MTSGAELTFPNSYLWPPVQSWPLLTPVYDFQCRRPSLTPTCDVECRVDLCWLLPVTWLPVQSWPLLTPVYDFQCRVDFYRLLSVTSNADLTFTDSYLCPPVESWPLLTPTCDFQCRFDLYWLLIMTSSAELTYSDNAPNFRLVNIVQCCSFHVQSSDVSFNRNYRCLPTVAF